MTEIDASATHVAEDDAGNMTKVPVPGSWSSHYDLTYDAWNRLVELKSGMTTVQTNQYDGLHRRIICDETGNGGNKRHFYYNERWQVVEERIEVMGSEYTLPLARYVWHPYYVDALAVRYYDADTDGDYEENNDGRQWYLQDANFNVTAVVNDSGTVLERYDYTPYGEVTFLDGSFASPTSSSAIGNNYLYTGRERDPKSGLYNYRTRFYHAPLGRFTSRDWIEYGGGMNLYAYVESDPISFVDPFGFEIYIQTHPVGGSGHHHLSILIIPDDQKKWAGCEHFKQLPDGRWYTTIGAGSKRGLGHIGGDMGSIVAEHLRPTDDKTARISDADLKKDRSRRRHKLKPGEHLKGDENAWIQSLLDAVAGFDNGRNPYAMFPEDDPLYYNSNSFIAGLLD